MLKIIKDYESGTSRTEKLSHLVTLDFINVEPNDIKCRNYYSSKYIVINHRTFVVFLIL